MFLFKNNSYKFIEKNNVKGNLIRYGWCNCGQ